MNYELMWMALKHALVDKSSDNLENPFYPAIELMMAGMEWYSELKEKEGKEPSKDPKTEG